MLAARTSLVGCHLECVSNSSCVEQIVQDNTGNISPETVTMA